MLFEYEVSIVLILLDLIGDVRRLCVLRMVSVVLALVAMKRGFYVESYSLTRRVDLKMNNRFNTPLNSDRKINMRHPVGGKMYDKVCDKVGILGGMGPLATVDFIQKIISKTPAQSDQDHIPLLIHSVPQIPDRTACLMEGAASPLPALKMGLDTLVQGGAGCIAIPCNTAHYWHEALAKETHIQLLHIAKVCAERIAQDSAVRWVGERRVGLLATDGTLKAGFYERELASFGLACTLPANKDQMSVMEGIYLVKSGKVNEGAALLELAMQKLLDNGAERVILGCTEIPLALESIHSPLLPLAVDATGALADACVAWYLNRNERLVA
ncbi:aspartate/glutamate racemase family protein [Litoribrevibacter euphylliae]|uniref:Aspartate/glutamate racemase family protein n=1 Tax=Litoribrevibacter euphylliae TaxID=1834034 RepID=A0ABV7HFX3_9GAMM